MKIERANLAAILKMSLEESRLDDLDRAIDACRFDVEYISMRTQQIRDALEAVENGDQLEIVD